MGNIACRGLWSQSGTFDVEDYNRNPFSVAGRLLARKHFNRSISEVVADYGGHQVLDSLHGRSNKLVQSGTRPNFCGRLFDEYAEFRVDHDG